MKRILAFVLSVSLMISALSMLSGCSGEDNAVSKTGEVVYVYNWGEYISNGDDGSLDTNAQFEKETGIEVKYLNFSSNEEMYAKMKSGGMTVDVIVPSDYMISQLIHEGLLEKLNYDNIPNYKNIDEKFRKPVFDPTGEYSLAYTWGCTAVFYDSRYVDEADIDENTWDLLWNEKYSGKILMFNNQRDAFGVAEAKLGYSLNTENPWAKPRGMKSMRWFSSVSSTASCWPNVGEPWRRSTTTSSTAPRTHLTSLLWL